MGLLRLLPSGIHRKIVRVLRVERFYPPFFIYEFMKSHIIFPAGLLWYAQVLRPAKVPRENGLVLQQHK